MHDPVIDPTRPAIGTLNSGECFRFPIDEESGIILIEDGKGRMLRLTSIALFRFIERTINFWDTYLRDETRMMFKSGKPIGLNHSPEPQTLLYLPFPANTDGGFSRFQIVWGGKQPLVDISAVYVLDALIYYINNDGLRVYYDDTVSNERVQALRQKLAALHQKP